MTDATGLVVTRRLHRLVRHGFRPWLGYAANSGQDGEIMLKRKGGNARLLPDGTLVLASPGAPPVAAADHAGFDALFPPNTPNKRNLLRRLYEIGV